jgi:hypothetical protein
VTFVTGRDEAACNARGLLLMNRLYRRYQLWLTSKEAPYRIMC